MLRQLPSYLYNNFKPEPLSLGGSLASAMLGPLHDSIFIMKYDDFVQIQRILIHLYYDLRIFCLDSTYLLYKKRRFFIIILICDAFGLGRWLFRTSFSSQNTTISYRFNVWGSDECRYLSRAVRRKHEQISGKSRIRRQSVPQPRRSRMSTKVKWRVIAATPTAPL